MPDRHLTLRITTSTDVAAAVTRLAADLSQAGVTNPALIDLVRNTGLRFQHDLTGTTDGRSAGASTQLSGASYRIRITTQPATKLDDWLERILPWQVSFS